MEFDRITDEPVRVEYERFKRGLSPSHLLIAEWIIQNPGGTYKEMGAFFGYSAPWLCTLCNSDMFKAHLATRVKDIQAVTTQDVPEKMRVLANLACDRMMEVLEKSEDKDQLTDAFDKVMHRYGYAPNAKNGAQQGPQIGQQNNVFFLSQEKLQEVRGQLINSHEQPRAVLPLPAKQEDDKQAPVSVEKV